MTTTFQVKFETEYCWNAFITKSGLEDGNIKSVSVDTMGQPYDVVIKKARKTKTKPQVWSDYHIGMPLYKKERGWFKDIKITFYSDKALESWLDIHNTKITGDKSFWYSPRHGRYKGCFITDDNPLQPHYTIYIPSKGRANCCKTADTMVELGVEKWFIIVEAHQFDDYAKVYGEDRLLTLPQKFLDEYDTCDELGDSKSKGPGAARNFAWWHSINVQKEAYHTVCDDNASGVVQMCPGNFRIPIKTPTFFRISEEFMERFDDVAQFSWNYRFFVVGDRPSFLTNTRAYSFILIRNDVSMRWRGRYNEDTILSIDCMEAGWKTIMSNQFLFNKAATQTMSGGNSTEFYEGEGTTNKSQMLYDVYPQYVKLVERWGRPHHYVDYVKHWGESGQTLTYKEGVEENVSKMPDINSYGLYLTSKTRTDIYPQCLI